MTEETRNCIVMIHLVVIYKEQIGYEYDMCEIPDGHVMLVVSWVLLVYICLKLAILRICLHL